MSNKVTLVDYGIGNLFNLMRAFEHVGAKPHLISDIESIRSADRLVFPGVGAFGEGIGNLTRLGLIDALKEFAKTGKPMFGICLGMQLLFSRSEELGEWKGLDILSGDVLQFPKGSWKLPQINWNTLHPARSWDKTILHGIEPGTAMYFNHSYFVKPSDKKCSLATTAYAGIDFASVVHSENIAACQFHPERSGEFGLKILSNFANRSL